MGRNYTKKNILEKFSSLKNLKSSLPAVAGLSFGTDIIVAFPGETDTYFQETYDLCKEIGFTKIHVFKYSPRPGTVARKLFLKSPKLSKETIKQRSAQLRKL
jgi:threonylcarbamoyladenosine tRNA methylthiotransferase MtaB